MVIRFKNKLLPFKARAQKKNGEYSSEELMTGDVNILLWFTERAGTISDRLVLLIK